MQYAKVYVDVKSAELDKYYYYLIPPKILPYIKKYCVVSVPYGNKTKLALVSEIVRSVSSDIKTKLKSIKKLVYNFPVIDDRLFYIAKQTSGYYLSGLGKTLFCIIPKLSKRMKNTALLPPNDITIRTYHKYIIYNDISSRFEYYEKIIKKSLTKNSDLKLTNYGEMKFKSCIR